VKVQSGRQNGSQGTADRLRGNVLLGTPRLSLRSKSKLLMWAQQAKGRPL
jgi:hypothetical protein